MTAAWLGLLAVVLLLLGSALGGVAAGLVGLSPGLGATAGAALGFVVSGLALQRGLPGR